MTKNTKAFIVILVILVIVFVSGVVIGSGQDEGNGEINFFESSLAQDIRTRFSTRVRIDEIRLNTGASPNGCLLQEKQMFVPGRVSLPCQINIAAAAEEDQDSVRTMTLHFADGPPGATLNVKLEQPNSDKALTVNKELQFGERLDLEVYEGAARLKVGGCPEAVQCIINLTVGNAAESN